MCNKAAATGEGELHFFSKKNKAARVVYLSKRTTSLIKQFISLKELSDGDKLFSKPDKNLQKNLRKYLYTHV